jgi:hypothetical protein
VAICLVWCVWFALPAARAFAQVPADPAGGDFATERDSAPAGFFPQQEPQAIGKVQRLPGELEWLVPPGRSPFSAPAPHPSSPGSKWEDAEVQANPPVTAQPRLVQYEMVQPQESALGGLQPGGLQPGGLQPGGYVQPGYWDGSEVGDSGEYVSQILPQGLIYRAYLAGEKESRFRSVWNNERNLGWKWDISLGGHVGLYRYGTTGNARPEGFQIDIEGAALLRLDPEENRDVDSVDFRFGVPLTWGTEKYQGKLAFYHLSSHLADEFLLKNVGYPRLNYSRDVFVLGQSYYLNPELRIYGEAGYALYSDVCKEWEFQFGIDYAPAVATGIRGAPFAAANGHLRQELNYGGNMVFQVGWAWRRSPASGLFRIGVQYFNGMSEQFSFYRYFENKVGFAIWYDY